MLEGCRNILECEAVIAAYIRQSSESGRQISLLCEVPLSEQDVEILVSCMADSLWQHPDGWLGFVTDYTPACLAIFLVWQAIIGYQDGDYWSAIRRTTGVSDRRLESKWGSAFLGFLRTQRLVRRPDTRAHRYVAPILLHAGIPDSCLPEYFRQIVWGCFVNQDVTEPDNILGEVGRMRKEAQSASRSEIQDEIEKLSAEQRRCERVRRKLVTHRELTRLLEEDGHTSTTIVEALGIAVALAELKSRQESFLQVVDRLDEEIRNLEIREDEQLLLGETRLREVSASLGEAEAQVKLLKDQEDDLALELARILSKMAKRQWERELYARLVPSGPRGDWRWLGLIIQAREITRELLGGNLGEKNGTAEAGRSLLEQQAAYFQELAKFQRILVGLLDDVVQGCPERIRKIHGLERVALRGDGAARETATGLVAALAKTLDGWRDEIAAARERRSKLADIAAEMQVVEQQLEAVDALVAEKTRMLKQVASVVPGLQEHVEVPDSKVLRKAQADLEKNRAENQKRLERISEELTSLLGRDLDPNTVDREMEEVQGQLRFLLDQKRRIEQDVPLEPLMWVDRPIQRFLLYGGQAADDFTRLTVAMLVSSCADGEPQVPEDWPGTYRYERIWNAFSAWWREEGRELCTVGVRLPRPRLVCWYEDSWQIGVQMPEELLDLDGLSIRHDGQVVEESRRIDGCWPLVRLDGSVEIGGTDAPILRLDRLQQKGKPCFIFRGWDDRTGPLPVVRRVTAGKVVVIVPEDWSRDSAASGSAPVADEALAVPGYRAHFFNLTREDGLVSFVLPDGSHFSVETGARHFELVGERLDLDHDHEMGPLFVGRPPWIRPVRQCAWDGAGRVVLITRARRREAVELDLTGDRKEQDLSIRSNGQGLECGCYWVVVYDRERYEMERLPFRFIPGLRDVKVQPQQVPIFPPSGGHRDAIVDFLFDPETVPDIQGEALDGDVRTEWGGGRLRVVLPPHPRFDEVEFEVRVNQGRAVPVRVILERIWWAIGNEDERLSDLQWGDKVVDLDRDWFRPTSQKVLWIRWPCGGQVLAAILAVDMGFDPDSRRKYLVRKAPAGDLEKARIVPIPLREFTSAWVEERGEDQSLFLWLPGWEGQDLGAAVVGAYRAPADPERRKSCATCDFARIFRKHCRCVHRKWSWMTLAQFNQLRAGYVCDLWDGEILAYDGGWVSPSKSC